ncbi:MAG: FHA domain-containing protein [Bryobacterales bacterium]
MVLRAPSSDPARLVDQVPTWIANTRKEAHRALGEVELGVRRAVEEAAAAIAGRSRYVNDPEALPSIDDILEDSLRFLGSVGPILDVLADRLVHVLGVQLQALDRQATELGGVPEASLRAARAGWDRAIRAYAAAVGQYVAGFVEGGGIAFALWTELPPELAGHTGEVATILAERLSFVSRRTEAVVSRWLADVQRELEDLLRSLSGEEAPDRLEGLLARAKRLGIRVKKVPEAPSERWLGKLDAQLTEAEARLSAHTVEAEERAARLTELLELAKRVRVSVRNVPERPSDGYLDKMQARLLQIAERKGVSVPPSLGGATPSPSPRGGELLDEETQEIDRVTDEERRARVDALRLRADDTGLDLGRVPPDPSMAWIVVTEAKLEAAVQRQRQERRGRRKSREAERRARIERLHHQASQLGVELAIPPFPTDEWLGRAELRIAALVLTPAGGRAPSDVGRAERFNRIYAVASSRGLSLGPIPPDPDDAWLLWAEGQLGPDPDASDPIAVGDDPEEVRAGAVLVFEEGTIQEHSFALGDQPVTIGRSRDNGIQIRDDAGVSRRHCIVRCERGRWLVSDTGSTKGVLVNGQLVDQAFLTDGAVLRLGDTQYVFRLR